MNNVKHYSETNAETRGTIFVPSDVDSRGRTIGWVGTEYIFEGSRFDLTKDVMRRLAARFGPKVRVSGWDFSQPRSPEWLVIYDASTGGYEAYYDGQPTIITGRVPDPHESDVLANL